MFDAVDTAAAPSEQSPAAFAQTDAEAERQRLEVLEEEICKLAAHIAAATCRWLLLIAEWDERRGWAEWGVTSCANWMSWRCSIAPGTAREQVRVARRLTELPRVCEAFASGELSFSKVRAITRVADASTEEYLVHLGKHATGAQLERIVRGYKGALAASLDTAEHEQAFRKLTWQWAEDGSLIVHGRLPAEEGKLFITAIQQAAEALRTDEQPPDRAQQTDADASGVFHRVTWDERLADALGEVSRAALAHQREAGARAGGDPCELVVHVDAETLAADTIVSRSELEDGPSLAPETVRRLGCDAAMVRIVERDGQPLSVGRRTRTIPPALRRALRSRDRGCRFPGCTHTRFLHAHHIRHWARGGRTDLDNLVHLCSYHHRLVHEGGYRVECAGRRSIRFRRPDGRPIPAVARPSGCSGPGIEAQNCAGGVEVNADTCRAKSAGDPLDYGLAVDGLLSYLTPP